MKWDVAWMLVPPLGDGPVWRLVEVGGDIGLTLIVEDVPVFVHEEEELAVAHDLQGADALRGDWHVDRFRTACWRWKYESWSRESEDEVSEDQMRRT
jgi:hypothetical protein